MARRKPSRNAGKINQVTFTLDDRRTGTILDFLGQRGGRITRNDLPPRRRLPYTTKGPRSSNVLRVEYNNSNSMMYVTYNRRAGMATYEYYGVPLKTFRDFKKRASAGKFVWSNIRRPPPTRYPYLRIR